jgi:hypothetical protein
VASVCRNEDFEWPTSEEISEEMSRCSYNVKVDGIAVGCPWEGRAWLKWDHQCMFSSDSHFRIFLKQMTALVTRGVPDLPPGFTPTYKYETPDLPQEKPSYEVPEKKAKRYVCGYAYSDSE